MVYNYGGRTDENLVIAGRVISANCTERDEVTGHRLTETFEIRLLGATTPTNAAEGDCITSI